MSALHSEQHDEDAPVVNEKMTVRYPDVNVRLVGEDGNVFNIIGRVRAAIWRRHGAEAASEFVTQATGAGSYDEVLALCMRTVNVS